MARPSSVFKTGERVGHGHHCSVFERRASGVYHNSAAVLDADGSHLGIYRKMHIPDDPGFLEKFYFTPGDLGFKVFKTRYANISVLICWDQWFPEGARLAALGGADIIFYPTAIGWNLQEAQLRKICARLGNLDARPRHCQWRLHRRGQSHRQRR